MFRISLLVERLLSEVLLLGLVLLVWETLIMPSSLLVCHAI